MSEVFVDASLFLGMHSHHEETRVACKGFFVAHLPDLVVMSLEQVGYCDDVVWGFDRSTQDRYYPFMDNLHTIMPIERRPYGIEDVRVATTDSALTGLSTSQRLLLGMVKRHCGVLYTADPGLLGQPDLPVAQPPPNAHSHFPAPLEQLYEQSLALRIAPQAIPAGGRS